MRCKIVLYCNLFWSLRLYSQLNNALKDKQLNVLLIFVLYGGLEKEAVAVWSKRKFPFTTADMPMNPLDNSVVLVVPD